MKFLKEISNSYIMEMVTEGEGSSKKAYVKGLFLEFDNPNRNNRIYRSEWHDPTVEKYIQEKVKGGNAWGELDHPDSPTINLKNACWRIMEMNKDKSNWYGKAILSTEGMGRVVAGLLDTGGKVGTSSRGMGSVKSLSEGSTPTLEVQKDFRLLTAGDAVSDPSAHGAFVDGIMENVEWYFNESTGSWMAEKATEVRQKIKKMSLTEIQETKSHMFMNFLNELKNYK